MGEHVEVEISVLAATAHIDPPRPEIPRIAHPRTAQNVVERVRLDRDGQRAKAGIVHARTDEEKLIERPADALPAAFDVEQEPPPVRLPFPRFEGKLQRLCRGDAARFAIRRILKRGSKRCVLLL